MPDFILTGREDATAILTLNRPEVMNAWDRAMRVEILDAMAEFAADDAVRALVITGAGDRAFCAGQDLNEAKDFTPDQADAWIDEWRVLYTALDLPETADRGAERRLGGLRLPGLPDDRCPGRP